MSAPVAIFAVGNRSRGDDAAGPLLLDRLREALPAGAPFELFEEYQLQVENALDLEDRPLVLFIDASREALHPVELRELGDGAPLSGPSTHALSPQALLGVFRQVTGLPPPPAFALGVRAGAFELGEGPSAQALAALEEAWGLLQALVRSPVAAEWRTMAAVARG